MAIAAAGSGYSKVRNFLPPKIQSSFGLTTELQHKSMEERSKDEQLIGKLIKKRKQENDAFQKLLRALEGKGQPGLNLPKANKKKS